MKFRKSILMGTGVVLAGMILTLLAPRAAHAIVATAVSVVNTSSNPVPVSSIDGPGRVPFIEIEPDVYCGANTGYCLTAFTTPVPAGHRVVITNVSGRMFFDTFPTAIALQVTTTAQPVGGVYFNVPVANNGSLQYFNAPIAFYFDAGQIPQIAAITNGIFLDIGNGPYFRDVTLVGYELDCTVAPCPAVATQ